MLQRILIGHLPPNGYIVPMEYRIHFFPRISAFFKTYKNVYKLNASNWD